MNNINHYIHCMIYIYRIISIIMQKCYKINYKKDMNTYIIMILYYITIINH